MRIFEEGDKRFFVAKSRIPRAGKGLFAKAALKRGQGLEVKGALVKAGSVADACTRYTDPYKFRAGKLLLIPTGYGGMANHSSRPNMVKVVKGKKVYLKALRPIEKGEELLYVYGERARRLFRK